MEPPYAGSWRSLAALVARLIFAAAFLLAQRGFKAFVLEGGLRGGTA